MDSHSPRMVLYSSLTVSSQLVRHFGRRLMLALNYIGLTAGLSVAAISFSLAIKLLRTRLRGDCMPNGKVNYRMVFNRRENRTEAGVTPGR